MKRRRFKSTPDVKPTRSTTRPGQYICGCRRGYASLKDGMCSLCRGGTLEEKRIADFKAMGVNNWRIKVFNGVSKSEFLRTGTYSQVAATMAGKPPGCIWSIETA